ncbi:MAG: reverse transcriptase/maturase family protein [Desulfobacteraceae bacterium]
MKRRRIALERVADYPNLLLAAYKASRGKHQRREVLSFFNRLDKNLNQLSNDILKEKVPDGRMRSFYIFDPKKRLIHAACFKDRVLHHALMNLAGPVLDRSLVSSSFACRPKKGIHSAVTYVQSKLRRYSWYVKLDMEHYFDNIDHQLLIQLLSGRFKGRGFMEIIRRILSCYQTLPGKGLPIGSLTSQHFANYYLDGLDRYIMEELKALAHVRYMDDIVLWCSDRQTAKQMLAGVIEYSQNKRLLRIKPVSIQINQSKRGITFCGFRILPGTVRMGIRRKKRYGALRRKWENMYLKGLIDAGKLQQGYAAVHAMTLHVHSRQWRRKHLQQDTPLEA